MSEPLRLIQRIQDVLSPDLIDRTWQTQSKEKPLHGYCYVSSEALYHLWGREHGFKPAQMHVHVGNGTRYSHWFLRDSTGAVIDITASQFGRTRIHYHLARGCGFLSAQPSNAAKEIMRRIGNEPAVLASYRELAR